MIYWDSSTAASFKPNDDEFSPYFEDKYGNIHRKDDVQTFVDTFNQTFYRDLFFAVDPTLNLTTPLKVTQEADPTDDSYTISVFTFVQIYFGFLNGALNALPVGGNLYDCGKDLESQRLKLVSMTDYFNERKLTLAVTDGYNALKYVNPISVSCYYGGLEYFNL